ncbi:MAG TPA: ABC transporter permease subunit [Acidimicrobiales bacterium]|nr:ABC transporter permease subunit [Acidimicrobiales bacterium]
MSVDLATTHPPTRGHRPGPATAITTLSSRTNGGAARVVFQQTVRKSLRSGVLWGYVFGAYIAAQALAYDSTYKTQAARNLLAKSFSSGGLNAVMGTAHELQTVAGYTAWKSLGALSIMGAVWALLIATKLLRGEEDAGRWELFLAGRTTRRKAAAQGLAGLGVAATALFVVTAVITVVVGRFSKVQFSTSAAGFFALSVTASAVLFLAVGALCSQIGANRRQAAAYAGTTLGLFFALRMLADTASSLTWLRWVSPLGWVEQLQPLTNPQPMVLVPIFALTVLVGALAIWLAGTRDLGSSTIPDRPSAAPHTRLLSGNLGLTIRLIRPTILGWWAGIAAFALLLGAVAKQAAKSIEASPSAEAALIRLGGRGGEIKAYLAVSYLIIALLVVLVAAGQVTAARREEAAGRIEHFLVRPVSLARWMSSRFAAATAAVAVGGALAGIATWLGILSQHVTVSFVTLLEGGLNTVPPAICLLGIGTLVWGVAPRLASSAVYAVLAWSFLVELLAGIVNSNHWLLNTSLFHQMAAAPAVAPDWVSGGVMLAVGVAAAAIGTVAFAHRDLAGE